MVSVTFVTWSGRVTWGRRPVTLPMKSRQFTIRARSSSNQGGWGGYKCGKEASKQCIHSKLSQNQGYAGMESFGLSQALNFWSKPKATSFSVATDQLANDCNDEGGANTPQDGHQAQFTASRRAKRRSPFCAPGQWLVAISSPPRALATPSSSMTDSRSSRQGGHQSWIRMGALERESLEHMYTSAVCNGQQTLPTADNRILIWQHMKSRLPQ